MSSVSLPAFPELPVPPTGAWPGPVYRAYDVFRDTLQHARGLALQEDGADRTRVLIVVSRIRASTMPLLQSLVDELQNEGFKNAACCSLGFVLAQLDRNAAIETSQ